MTRVAHLVVSAVIGTGCITSVLLFHRLTVYPVAVATLLPITAGVVYTVLRVVGTRSAAPRAQEPISLIALHTVTFIICLHVLVICTLAGVGWARALGPRAPVVLLGVAIAAAGNLLPRLRRNLAIGIRSARTLDDPRLWSHLHRRAGYGAVALGVVTCIAGVFLPGRSIGPVLSAATLMLAAATAVSYWRDTHD